MDKPLVANGRGPYRRSCPKGLSTPTLDQGAIPGQAEIETPSGRKAIADHGPATADDDRDSPQGRQRPPRRNGAVPSDIRFPDGCVPTTRRARHAGPPAQSFRSVSAQACGVAVDPRGPVMRQPGRVEPCRVRCPWKSRIVGSGEEAPDQLLANPSNWRVHPKAQRAALAGPARPGRLGRSRCSSTSARATSSTAISGSSAGAQPGQPTVPVLYVDLEPEEEALVLASLDPLAAMAGTDDEKLRALLADVSVDSEALAAMLAELAPPQTKAGLTDPDDIPAPPDEATTQARRPLAPRRPPPPLRRRRERRGPRPAARRRAGLAARHRPALQREGRAALQQRHRRRALARSGRPRPTTRRSTSPGIPRRRKPTDRKLRAKDRPLANDFVSDEDVRGAARGLVRERRRVSEARRRASTSGAATPTSPTTRPP